MHSFDTNYAYIITSEKKKKVDFWQCPIECIFIATSWDAIPCLTFIKYEQFWSIKNIKLKNIINKIKYIINKIKNIKNI